MVSRRDQWQDKSMRVLAAFLTLLCAGVASANGAPADPAETFIRQNLQTSSYRRADADLNGDGRREVFIYDTDPRLCGSGGCTLVVLSPHGQSYRTVMRTTVTQLPIKLLPTSTRGWRDIGVTVSGGGITKAYLARMRFNGQRYPSNPTVPPATPLNRPSGKTLISN